QGLVFTDALNMDGVAKYFEPGDVDLRAFLAGNDVLLFSQDVPTAIRKIKAAIDEDRIPYKELELRVKKILAAKYDAGLHNRKDVVVQNVTADLNAGTQQILFQMAEASATFVRDRNQLVNKLVRKEGGFTYVGVNAGEETQLLKSLKNELPDIQPAWFPKGGGNVALSRAMNVVEGGGTCIVAVHNMGF